MSEETEGALIVGDFIVLDGRWRFPVVRLVKVTAQTVQYAESNSQRSTRIDKSKVLFSGDEDSCRVLAEKLTSSAAIHDQERRAASERHQARRVALIVAAHEGK